MDIGDLAVTARRRPSSSAMRWSSPKRVSRGQARSCCASAAARRARKKFGPLDTEVGGAKFRE
jgi:hypothetical protein